MERKREADNLSAYEDKNNTGSSLYKNYNFLPARVADFCTAVSPLPVESSKWKENFTFMDQ